LHEAVLHCRQAFLIHIQLCTRTRFMSNNKDSTGGEAQIIVNTTSTPFSSLTFNQDKLRVRCMRLSQPRVTELPDSSLGLNYEYTDWYRVRIIF
jgi:hypothetical protein